MRLRYDNRIGIDYRPIDGNKEEAIDEKSE